MQATLKKRVSFFYENSTENRPLPCKPLNLLEWHDFCKLNRTRVTQNIKRATIVIKKPFLMASLLLASLWALPSHALFISFEEFSSPGCCTYIDSYRGLTWGGGKGDESWVVANEAAGLFPGAQALHGNNFAWSNGGQDLTIEDGTFDFVNFWARTGNASTGTATASGFRNGSQIYTQSIHLTDQYQQFNLDFINIDSWVLSGQTDNVLIDAIDMPAPTPLALLAIGLAALWRLNRKAAIEPTVITLKA